MRKGNLRWYLGKTSIEEVFRKIPSFPLYFLVRDPHFPGLFGPPTLPTRRRESTCPPLQFILYHFIPDSSELLIHK